MNNPAKALIDGLFDQMVGPTHETQGTPIDFMTDRPETTECAGCGDIVLEGVINPDGHLCEECDAPVDFSSTSKTARAVANKTLQTPTGRLENATIDEALLATVTLYVADELDAPSAAEVADACDISQQYIAAAIANCPWVETAGAEVILTAEGRAHAVYNGWLDEAEDHTYSVADDSRPTLDEVAVESCCFHGEYFAPDTAQVLVRIADHHKVGKKHAGASLDASVEAGLIFYLGSNQVDLAWKGVALAIEKGWMQENDAQWDRLMATTEVPEESNEDEEPQLYTVKELVAQQRVAAEIAQAEAAEETAPKADDTAQAPEAQPEAPLETPSPGLTIGTAEEGTFVLTSTGKLRLIVRVGDTARVVRQRPCGDFVTGYTRRLDAPCFPTRPPHSVRVAAYRVLSEKDRKRLGIDLLLGAAAARAVASAPKAPAPKAPAPKATPTSREGQPVGFSVQDFRAMEELVEGMTYRLALCETQQIHVEKKFDALVNGLAALIHEVRS